MHRRAFLQAAGLSALALAGCSAPGDGSPETTTSTDTTTTTETTTDTTTTTEETTTETTTTETTTTTPAPTLVNPSFESGLDGWTVGRDLPEDPNDDDPDAPVDSSVETTTERASDGETSLAITIDGSQDDGTVWVEQPVDLSAGDTLAFDVYSPMASFNTRIKAAAYTGPGGELAEADFDTSKAADGHEGWKTFEYEVSGDGEGVVAVGISVVWETEVTGVLDNVRLTDSTVSTTSG